MNEDYEVCPDYVNPYITRVVRTVTKKANDELSPKYKFLC